jgi:3-hydroxyacyl-CoA dehydrogenase
MSAAVQGEPHVRDIDIMANATKRSQDVADTHFFAPANVMKLF